MIEVSIILPVYNVEKYIHKCIYSILDQSFRNFELIVIDDCGSDNSIAICEKILGDSDICYKIIHNKINKGLSESRNIGIDNSNSKFILFVDSDDWIDPFTLEKLYVAAQENNADFVSCRIIKYWEDSNEFYKLPNLNDGTYTAEDYLNAYFNNKTNPEVWSKLIKRNLLEDIKFPKKVIFEDLLTVPYIIKKANKIIQINEYLYFYVKRSPDTSITGTKPTNISGFLYHLRKLKSDFEVLSTSNSLNSKKFIYKNLLAITYSCILFQDSNTMQELKLISAFIKIKDLFKIRRIMPYKHLIYLYILKLNRYLFYFSFKTIYIQRIKSTNLNILKLTS